MIGVLSGRGHSDTDAHRDDDEGTQGEGHVKTEDCGMGQPPTRNKKEEDAYLQILEGMWPCQHPDIRLVVSTTKRQ